MSHCRSLFGHLLHASVLLLPTIVIQGALDIGWEVVCFGAGITLAAIVESLAVQPHFHFRTAVIRDRLAMRVAMFVGISMLGLFWLAQIERLIRGPVPLVLHVIGSLLLAFGILLRFAAIRSLGRMFVSDIRCDGFIQDGIYRFIRHPSEIGLLLIATGAPLLLGAPFMALIAVVVYSPISLWRVAREDNARASDLPTTPETPGQ